MDPTGVSSRRTDIHEQPTKVSLHDLLFSLLLSTDTTPAAGA